MEFKMGLFLNEFNIQILLCCRKDLHLDYANQEEMRANEINL